MGKAAAAVLRRCLWAEEEHPLLDWVARLLQPALPRRQVMEL